MGDLGRTECVNASRAGLPDPELLCLQLLSLLTGAVGIREKLCFSTWVFGGWFYLLLGVGGCRAFACSGFGFFSVCMFGVFVWFSFSSGSPFRFFSFPAGTSIIIITC